MKAVLPLRALTCLLTYALLAAITSRPTIADDGDPQWIWSPAHEKDEVPPGTCYFRKTFRLQAPESGQIQITADNRFQLFVNGQPVAKGADWREMQVHDVTPMLRRGVNAIAVQVDNLEEGPAGLVARVLVKQRSGAFEGFSSGDAWKSSVRRFQGWTMPQFNDKDWVGAKSYGALGATLPWANEVVIEGQGARFEIGADFEIGRLMRHDEVGSLIAMAFDAQGNILASQEGGHLLLLADNDRDGVHETVTTYCDQLENVQGILPLGTRVFAVGSGPEGPALYRLRDADRDGAAEEVTKLVGFRGSRGEHGAHAVRLGPDGMIYVIIGDHARVDAKAAPNSPYARWYEGDLVKPRYEDPQGHAVGIPAPGGTIIRTDADGASVELVAGGLRNSYDFAFNAQGEIFTYDADMEWDLGAPWYRPTRVNHVTAGAELGWRSGWAKWPEYFFDSLPAAVDMGAGSPTGVEFYEHTAFPRRYRGAMFGCDWAAGRIYAVTFQRDGATYRGKTEVFLEGRPLNVTDVAVGPHGALYFCTGGRGTDGGVYRVVWSGQDDADDALGVGVQRALKQPQFESDWARAQIARIKRSAGPAWQRQLDQVAQDQRRPTPERLRAVDLLVTFGPRPTDPLLRALAADERPELRAAAARLMFVSDDPVTREKLTAMLQDDDPLVRRVACESLMRRGPRPPADRLLPLLEDEDRFVAFAAMRALEKLPVDQWARRVLDAVDVQAFCYGAGALLNVERLPPTSIAVLRRCEELLGEIDEATQRFAESGMKPSAATRRNRRDLLRLAQLALIHGDVAPDDAAPLGRRLLAAYPTDERFANREVVRLLTYLQVDGAADAFAAQLETDLPTEDKLQIAAYAAHLSVGWTTASKLALMKFLEEARTIEGGYSVNAYVEDFARDFFAKLSIAERKHILAGGERWPASALSVLAKLPEDPGPEALAEIRQLDAKVKPLCATHDKYRRLRVGVIAVLGRTPDAEAQEHLRRIYRDEPEYREPAAMSLTQQPGGENWNYLVDALRSVESPAAEEILSALATVPQRPRESQPYRNVILIGLREGPRAADAAVQLLRYWSGQSEAADNPRRNGLAYWQRWYADQYPDALAAELPSDDQQDRWSYDELLTFVESDAGKAGNPVLGSHVFKKAQCADCHRFGDRGDSIGPDLSTVAKRFQRKEILESIVHPSHVISDQYASSVVLANGRAYDGMLVSRGDQAVTVLLSNGKQVHFDRDEVEDVQPSGVSAMPTGLLNSLTLDDVADLFAYLSSAPTQRVAERSADQSAQ